jgi:hypothetical protein
MPYVATTGTASCATIAIGSFKGPGNQMALNENYKKDPKSFTEPKEGLSVNQFYSSILFPTSQPLGRTHDLPFTKLMEDIDNSSLKTKLVIATLNHSQYYGSDEYWPKELRKWGFKLFHKTKNAIGSVNYVFIRNPSHVDISSGEH